MGLYVSAIAGYAYFLASWVTGAEIVALVLNYAVKNIMVPIP
jgi:hypothetical protein